MKITFARFNSFAAALALVVIAAPNLGCSKSDAADQKESSDDEGDKDKKKKKKKGDKDKKKKKKKDTSEACKADKVIEVTNKSSKLPFTDGKFEVKTSRAYKDSAGFYELQLNNFEHEKRFIKKAEWKDEWASVAINIYNIDRKKPLELVKYDKKQDKVRYMGPGINTKKLLLGFAGADIGGVTIVHIDDEKMCGSIDIDDKYTKIKGNFIAKIPTK